MRKRLLLQVFIAIILCAFLASKSTFADITSPHYIFRDYSFGGSGGSNNSTNYSILGILGEGANGSTNSSSHTINSGLSYTLNSFVPPAPTLSTQGGNDYNKLFITLNTGNNPTDAEFAIAVSPDAFTATTQYIQTNDTLGSSKVWQTNSIWGASGFTLIGLTPSTTYSVKASAMQGNFSQSAFGPYAQATTAGPTLSFSISTNAVGIGTLTPTSVITAPTSVTLTLTTNGAAGGTIYVYDQNSGLLSSSTGSSIAAVSGDLSVVTQGYGLGGTSVSQSSGGPMESLSPYNVSGTNVGILSGTERAMFDSTSQPVTSGQATFQILAKAGNTTKMATDYADTITLIAAGSF